MRFRVVPLAITWAVVSSVQAMPAVTQAASPGKPVKLEQMDYFSARKIIVGYGWKPVAGPCEGVSAEACILFPEIESCSGVFPGYCAMVFVRQDRCLYITATGGEPEDKPSDTQVEDVTFGKSPCAKN